MSIQHHIASGCTTSNCKCLCIASIQYCHAATTSASWQMNVLIVRTWSSSPSTSVELISISTSMKTLSRSTVVGAVPRRTKHTSPRVYRLHPFAILMLNLTSIRLKKTKRENFNFVYLFSSFLSSSSLSHITWKLYSVCESYTYQTIPLLMEIICTCSELRVSYYWWINGLKTVSDTVCILVCVLLGFSCNNCVGVACSQATTRLLNVCLTGCDVFARN